MPLEVVLPQLPAGIAIESAQPNQMTRIQMAGFASSEDGDKLIEYLQGISDIYLANTSEPRRWKESLIDHFLAIVRPDCSATLYINELNFRISVTAKRALSAGEEVRSDDIADVERLRIDNVSIPANAGFVFLFSSGWRKAVYFDYVPLQDNGNPNRPYDIEILLGQIWSYVHFRDRVRISDVAWQGIRRLGWFPFIGLQTRTIKSMQTHAVEGWSADGLVSEIKNDIAMLIPVLRERILNESILESHRTMFLTAIRHYEQGDYASCASILYPRLEGLLRSCLNSRGGKKKANQNSLVKLIEESVPPDRRTHSLLLPDRFKSYIEGVYFANFTGSSDAPISRHSVSHGVASESQLCAPEASMKAILILHQLLHLIVPPVTPPLNAQSTPNPSSSM